jgi:hypothetical protein
MLRSWIFQENLESFLELLTWIAGCKFNEWDFNAVVAGIEGTNYDLDTWFKYEFEGTKRSVAFEVADDPGSSVYHFRFPAPSGAAELIELSLFAASSNNVRRHNSYGRR